MSSLAQDAAQESGFIDLDALLDESVSLASDKSELKKKKEKVSSAWLHGAEKQQLQKEIAAIEQRREWTSVARTHLFQAQLCTFCNTSHTHFAGTFLKQTHLKLHSDRWVRIEDDVAAKALPMEMKIDTSFVDMCINCHAEQENGK